VYDRHGSHGVPVRLHIFIFYFVFCFMFYVFLAGGKFYE